jgi:hypothetical protein
MRHSMKATLALFFLLLFGACDDESTGPDDVTSPVRVTTLTVVSAGDSLLTLRWTAPGDDGGSGTAASYQIRRSPSLITAANFASATVVPNPPAPASGGTMQQFDVTGIDTTVVTHFALRATDDAGNTSQVSNDAAWIPPGTPVHLMQDIPAFKDNTMYEEAADSSNGKGFFLFSGKTLQGDAPPPDSRRALMAFAIADSLPAGAVIDSVELRLRVSRAPGGSTPTPVALHAVIADWGEGASHAVDPEGFGGTAQANDATWVYRLYNTATWATPGGDFMAGMSAQTTVDNIGLYFWSSVQMTADVQGWLDLPGNNFGWILIGDESVIQTARRYDSREGIDSDSRPPRLRVWYTVLQ